jgi:hypothetical protein
MAPLLLAQSAGCVGAHEALALALVCMGFIGASVVPATGSTPPT